MNKAKSKILISLVCILSLILSACGSSVEIREVLEGKRKLSM
jgi:hypothetical protein